MKRSVAIIGLVLACALGFFAVNKMDRTKEVGPDSISDVVEHLIGVPGDTVVVTVDGGPVCAEDYLYWAGYTAEMMEYYQGGELDWAEEQEGVALLDYVKETALETAKLYRVVENGAAEMDCGLDEEDLAFLQTSYQEMVEQLGGREEMEKWLIQVGLSKEGFDRINQVSVLYENLLESLTDVSPADAEEMADYIAANDMLKAKHILLMTMDPNTREPLGEEVQAEKKAQAEDILARLQASEEPLILFDELMFEYSEDSGLLTNPDGYHFTANQMVAEFEQGTRDLAYGEISGIVESVYGYHIILRLDPADEALAADLGQLLGETEAQEKLDVMVSDWLAEAVVETTEAYDNLDVAAYYNGLKALRAEMEAAGQEAVEE